MFTKFAGAMLGKRLAGRNQGLRGAMIGAATPWLLRRAFTPMGLTMAGLYGAKKLYDYRRQQRGQGGNRNI